MDTLGQKIATALTPPRSETIGGVEYQIFSAVVTQTCRVSRWLILPAGTKVEVQVPRSHLGGVEMNQQTTFIKGWNVRVYTDFLTFN